MQNAYVGSFTKICETAGMKVKKGNNAMIFEEMMQNSKTKSQKSGMKWVQECGSRRT